MITIGGNRLGDAGLSYAPDSVEHAVLSAMREGAGTYAYDTLPQLQFELLLRREIVQAATRLHRSGIGFAVFNSSRCNPAYWDRSANGGFQLKGGVSPAKAIADIFADGAEYATECATAMMIVYYGALLAVFGEARFDKIFRDIYLMNWHIADPRLKAAGTPKAAEQLLLGDRGYFANPDVDPQTPWWQGENVIVMPGGKYYGHGVGFVTAAQIIRALNGNRKADASQSAYLMESAGRPDFRRLAELDTTTV